MDTLFREACTGSLAAIQQFYEQYAGPMLYVIRRKMNPELRAAFDSNDFMQQTLVKVLTCKLEQKNFDSPEALLGYMLRVAANEVQQVKRKHARAHEAPHHQKSLERLTPKEQGQLMDGAPPPEVVEAAEEGWRNAIDELPLVYKAVALRLRNGYTHAEIAAQLNICDRTVRRVVAILKEKLMKDAEGES